MALTVAIDRPSPGGDEEGQRLTDSLIDFAVRLPGLPGLLGFPRFPTVEVACVEAR